ncbi:MAG: ammonia-forming cytochrome c nitrite reductase subunit c552 [Legionella sp.]|nr:ammonia-forming cytochrome c nitrite reductase subunit c552 [Legionella sp.]
MSETNAPNPRKKWLVYGGLIVGTAAVTVVTLLLLESIRDRKDEATRHVFEVAQLDETIDDAEVWGRNYPRQYDSYLRTVDTQRTRFGGSEAFQKLDEDPRWRVLFKGYAFSIDYREERGHAYMLSDQRETERVTQRKQPGACLHCHASNVVAYRKAGVAAGAPGGCCASCCASGGPRAATAAWPADRSISPA